MKVMHLLNSDRYSGAENVVCQIIDMFRHEEDISMTYVSPDGQIREALADRDVTFIPIAKMSVSEVRKAIRRVNPDVIHAHDMRASFVASLVCGRIRLISHIHNNAFDSRRITLKSLAFLIAAKKAEHVFWVSDSAFRCYRFSIFCRNKSSVLCNVIDIDALIKKKDDDKKEYCYDMIYVGRLSYEKNPQRLVNIVQLVAQRCPAVKVAIVGTGELENEIKAKVREYHLESNIDFVGFVDNPLKMLYSSKLMLMTSRWEGTPMCALEAMILGVPIVSTPTDGLKALVEHEKTGFLATEDQELADYAIRIIQNSELHAKLSTGIREAAVRVNDILSYKAEIRRILFGNVHC